MKHKASRIEEPDRCRICGMEGPLTFEHVPPRSAFNRDRAEVMGLDAWLRRDAGGPVERGKIMQRGSGFESLCEICNNRAGRLYVPEFRKWTQMGMQVLHGPNGAAAAFADTVEESYVLIEADDVQPARFLKQVVTMFLAMSPPTFTPLHPDLASFAQDPEWIGLPERYQIYLALYSGPYARFVGGVATLRNIGTEKPIENHFVLEIAYPPFAYVLSIDENTPALACGNLAAFADVSIHDRASVKVQLINGYGHTPIPLDYRTLPAVEADRAA